MAAKPASRAVKVQPLRGLKRMTVGPDRREGTTVGLFGTFGKGAMG